jgi:hypothetical protein
MKKGLLTKTIIFKIWFALSLKLCEAMRNQIRALNFFAYGIKPAANFQALI